MPQSEALTHKAGDLVLGTVQEVHQYGALVDLGAGVSGSLHITQISEEKVESVIDILRKDDKIMVKVLKVIEEKGRISLTTKELEPNPGDMINNRQAVFDNAQEMVALSQSKHEEALRVAHLKLKVSATSGGALATHAIPISSSDDEDDDDAEGELAAGGSKSNHRIHLSTANEASIPTTTNATLAVTTAATLTHSTSSALSAGDLVLGTVKEVRFDGALIDLGDGVTGLLLVHDFSSERVKSMQKILNNDDKIKVMVLKVEKIGEQVLKVDEGNVEESSSRVSLSTKELESTPGDMINNPKAVFDNAEWMAALFRLGQ